MTKRLSIVSISLLRIIPVCAGLLIIIWLGIRYWALESVLKEVEENIKQRAKMTSQAVAEKFDAVINYGKSLAINDLIINSLIDFEARNNYLPTFFQSLKVPGVEEAAVFLTDYKGRLIVSNRSQNRGGYFFNPDHIEIKGENFFRVEKGFVEIVFPVIYSGQKEGYLIILININKDSTFFKIRSSSTKVSYSVYLKSGTLLYSNLKEDALKSIKDIEWIEKELPVPGYNDFHIMCKIKKKDSLSQYKRLEAYISGAMFFDIALLFLGLYLSSRIINRPLRHFSNLMENARLTGEFNFELPEHGPKEIASLAVSYNLLSTKIERLMKESLNKAIEAGRVQLAAMVLHNIGNAVTPLGFYIDSIKKTPWQEISTYLEKCYMELKENIENLTEFVTKDKRGQEIFIYMETLIGEIEKNRNKINEKVEKAEISLDYIAEILSVQQKYAPSHKESKEKSNLNQIVSSAVSILRATIDKREIELDLDLSQDLDEIVIDKNRFLQVVINCIKNSCEALEEKKGKRIIEIKTDKNESGTLLDIRDNGKGFDPDTGEELFKFGKSGKGSSGMGLYYCRMFMEANHGSIDLISSGKDRGAKIILQFFNEEDHNHGEKNE